MKLYLTVLQGGMYGGEKKKGQAYLCVELDLLFDFSVPHAGGCRKLGFIL